MLTSATKKRNADGRDKADIAAHCPSLIYLPLLYGGSHPVTVILLHALEGVAQPR